MAEHNKVIWYEGMALEPQHFQQQTRYFESFINFKLDLQQQSLWGFSELELDTDLLSIGKLGIAKARGIFQDGTIFSMPDTDDVPVPYSIPEGLTNTILYLALPIADTGLADAGDEQSKQRYRYQTLHKSIRDNIADSGEEVDVSVGSLATRILTESDDREGYLCLPLVRVKEVRSNHSIKFDKAFIPSMLDVHQTAPLEKFLEEVVTLLTNRAEMLAGRLTDTGQAGTSDMVDLTLLQLSNKFEIIFRNLQATYPLSPRKFYNQLVEMLAELSTYTTDKRRPSVIAPYQHDDLFTTYKPVIQAARKSLSMVLEQNATAIELSAQGHGLWVGEIVDKSLLRTASFVLAVYADLPMENIRSNFPSQIKIAPVEKIRTLVSRSLPGISLQTIAVAPRQIPYHPNFCYFAVDAKGELWQALNESQGIALHVSGDLPGVRLELWAIKG
jgi:type VI secretion system protein ImpJ